MAGLAASGIFAPARAQSIGVEAGGAFTRAGAEFRLIDILMPASDDSYAAEAATILKAILNEGRLDIVDAGDADRWRRRVVNVAVETRDGVRSVQELLILEGGARVRPESEDYGRIKRLLSAEEEARTAKRGLWRVPFYAVRDAATHRATGAFHLLEGDVVSAAVTKGRAFLNFGEDYRADVTATASSRDARKWAKNGLDWPALQGSRTRIRGYVAWINGPSIELKHPLQIETLTAAYVP